MWPPGPAASSSMARTRAITPAIRYPRPATSTATASTTSSSGLWTATVPATPAPCAGDSYVVFGKASGFAAEIDLAAVAAGNGGFVIHGQDVGDHSGYSVSSAGDINGDGFDDLIIGASCGDGPGNTRVFAGDSYVVFGKAVGLRGRDRPRRSRGRQRRLRHPWPGCAAMYPAVRCPRPATSTATASTT